MADTFTSLLRLVLQETGGNQNVWGDINNASAIDLLEDAIAARLDLDVTPATDPVTLTASNGADDQARNAIIALTGVPGGTRTIIVPSTSKLYIISNETADNMTIKTVANAGVVVNAGTRVAVVVDPVADDVFSIGDIPLATETVAGIAEIATQAEVDAGTDDERIVTPLKLAAAASLPQATETVRGAAELATQAETDLGTDDERIITPLKYEGRKSSETLSGHIELATQAEVDAGTDTERAVTPATLSSTPTGVFRGAKVFNAANFDPPDNTVPNWDNGTSGELALPFNAEVFDTDSIHDNATFNSRLTTPAGVSLVRLTAGVTMDEGDTGLIHMRFRLNGLLLAIDGVMTGYVPHSTLPSVGSNNANDSIANVAWTHDSGVIEVQDPGNDYFELFMLGQGNGTAFARGGKYWFEMEIIA